MSGQPVFVPDGPDAGLLWHRGEPFGEQKAFEAGRALVELAGREVLAVAGADRLEWLHSLSTGRFRGLAAGRAIDALLLSPTGQVRHVVHACEDGELLWLVSEAGSGGAVEGYLESMRFRMDVRLQAHPDVMAWWVGERLVGDPDLPAALAPEMPAPFGPGRLRLCGPVDASRDPRVVGMWAYEAQRIEAGVPRIGLDTDGRTLPNELGLYATALDKGCYTGQETVARVHNLGRPPRRLVRLLLDGSMDRLPAPGSAIQVGGEPCGRMGSSAIHHEDGPIGLGLVNRAVPVDAELVVDGIAAAQEVLVDPDIGLHLQPGRELRRR